MRQASHSQLPGLAMQQKRRPDAHALLPQHCRSAGCSKGRGCGGDMKIAAYFWGGKRHVGRVSEDGAELTPLALGEAGSALGVLALVEMMAAGKPMPAAPSPRLPMSAVRLDAPFPHPRRNVFCVGKNYREHAKEFTASGFDTSAPTAADA